MQVKVIVLCLTMSLSHLILQSLELRIHESIDQTSPKSCPPRSSEAMRGQARGPSLELPRLPRGGGELGPPQSNYRLTLSRRNGLGPAACAGALAPRPRRSLVPCMEAVLNNDGQINVLVSEPPFLVLARPRFREQMPLPIHNLVDRRKVPPLRGR